MTNDDTVRDPRQDEPSAQQSMSQRTRTRQLGQVLPIFVIMSIVLLGGAALLTDVAWWWSNQQQMQRAADAGALAGAIHLPGNEGLAFTTARAETAKNGYVHGTAGVVVTPKRDPSDPRKLVVDIAGPVGTHFAKVFCWDGGPCMQSVAVGVTGAASYVLPVPMGSPQNYYGVGLLIDEKVTTSTARRDDDTNWNPTRGWLATNWVAPWRAQTDNGSYAVGVDNGSRQVWRQFGLLGANEIPNDPTTVIDGLQVRLNDARAIGSGNASNCRIGAEVSWNGGGNWSTLIDSAPLSTTSNSSNRTLGSSSSTAGWGGHVWTRDDFSDANFQVRLTWRDGPSVSGCHADRDGRIDMLEVRVDYHYDQTSTTTTIDEVDVVAPDGGVLAPQLFWGALQSQGAPNIQGDAYMTYYDRRTSRDNSDYDPDAYYQYEVEFPVGSSNGEVWLFDPGFCEVGSSRGTGESWTVGGANGYNSKQPISTYYDLYDTRNTPYNHADDVLVGSSGSTFHRLRLSDHSLGQTSQPDCSNISWHNGWWVIANGLAGGTSYRLHTYSTDPNSSTNQRSSTALNAFAIWADAVGGTPEVHGIGAMEAYVRLPGGRSTEFYLAQIDDVHAGKTMQIRLWDPGDTGQLAANLQILRPTASTYQATTFSYVAERNSADASNCANRNGTNVNAVTTNTGGNSLYNGCWLIIEIQLPNNYSAPHPSSDTVTSQGGWWKIRYNMSGSTSNNSTDMTTWEVLLLGNPVHLVLE